MAEWLDASLPDSCRILVSPAARAVQTAEALGRKFKVVADLSPESSVDQVLAAANWPNSRDPVLVVGHQPTLGQVAALLLTGKAYEWEMKKAAAWWFVQRDAQGPDSLFLKAVMTADLIVK